MNSDSNESKKSTDETIKNNTMGPFKHMAKRMATDMVDAGSTLSHGASKHTKPHDVAKVGSHGVFRHTKPHDMANQQHVPLAMSCGFVYLYAPCLS